MFLDTANIKDINYYMPLGFLKGITTNPSILFNEKMNRKNQLSKIAEINPGFTFVQLVGDSVEELSADYMKIIETISHDKLGIKVPINYEGLKFIRTLKENEPERIVLGTAIYSAEQGILGSLAGCDYLAPYINRMLDNNIDSFEVISSIRRFIDSQNLETKIMGASFKNTNQVIKAYDAGAHTVTVSSDILNKMMNKGLAQDAIEVFNKHGRELDTIG